MGASESQIHRVRSDHQCETGVSLVLFVFCSMSFCQVCVGTDFFVKTIVDRWNFPLNHDGRNGTPSLINTINFGYTFLEMWNIIQLKKMHIGKKMH